VNVSPLDVNKRVKTPTGSLIALLTVLMIGGCSDSNAPQDSDASIADTTPAAESDDDGADDAFSPQYQQLMTDRLVDADYWQEEPAILAAGLGFTDINGVPGLSEPTLSLEEVERLARDAGAGWHAAGSYDDSCIEDHDNQIDIVLAGDRAAAERIAVVHIPGTAPYAPFYNPGGPGNARAPVTLYSEPSPEHFQPVTIALDDPMQVSYEP